MVFGLAHLAVHGACLAASVGASEAAASRRRREQQVAVQTVPTQYVISTNGVVHQVVNGQRVVPQQYVIRHTRQYQYPPQQHPQMYCHPQGPIPQQPPPMYSHPQGHAPQQQPPMYSHPQGQVPQQVPRGRQYQPQHSYYVQSPHVATAARPGHVPSQEAEEEENEMNRPPRRNPLKKLLRRLKASLCCTSGNQGEEDEEPMLSGSHGNRHLNPN